MRACFAQKNPKWDCHKWAHETGSTKSLPERKKRRYGGSMSYKRKKCMNCGGKMQIGGLTQPATKSYNPNLAMKDKNFQNWYRMNTLEGQQGIPYSEDLTYDYYSFFKNKGVGNIQDHFPDTYKRSNHPTFSDESIYSTPENPGGSWRGEKFIPRRKRMQEGGYPRQQDFPDYESWQQALDQYLATNAPGVPKINIQQQPISEEDFLPTETPTTSPSPEQDQGVLEPKMVDGIDTEANMSYNSSDLAYQQTYDRDLGRSVLRNGTGSERRNYRNFYRGKYGQGINPVDPFQIGLGLKQAQAGLSWLSGIVDRRRQRRYMQNQYSTLGQNTPIPVSNFQPNPYNLYAKLGGNIKKYMFTNDAENRAFPVDAGKMRHGGNLVMAQYHNLPKNKYEQLLQLYQNQVVPLGFHMMPDGTLMPDSEMDYKKGGKWIQKAINPEHKGYCTPMTKSTCTPRRRALARTFKKHHGFHKKK